MRADEETCHDVAEHERLLEPLEYDGDDTSGNEDEGKFAKKGVQFGHTEIINDKTSCLLYIVRAKRNKDVY